MKHSPCLFLLAVVVSQVYTAPQFISFKDGKLGVNFGGYHAGVGIGGLLGGTGTAGGLYAEAGTPTGQAARAGLGGSVDEKGGASGGLFAGATAGGNVKASAGLAGGVNAEKSAGGGFASAQAGNNFASSGLAGETSVQGSGGILQSSANNVQPFEVKPIQNNVEADFNIESANEVKPLEFVPLSNGKSEVQTKVELKGDIQPPVIVKEVSRTWRPDDYYYRRPIYHSFNIHDIINSVFEVRPHTEYSRRPWMMPQRKYNPRIYKVYVEQQPQVVEKHIIHTHYKPRRQHFRKTAYIGGYIGGGGDIAPPAVYNPEPAIEKRIDVGAEATANAGASIGGDIHGNSQVYTKQVTYQRNPSFFQDIFNIPISTLKAVGDFLSNTAGNTNVSVQKSASVQAADTESISAKHEPSSVSSSSAHISVETPSASKLIDDIFAILREGEEPTQVRLGPHARRRANKHKVIVQETLEKEAEKEA